MTFGGSCRCGAVVYTLAVAAAPPIYCCHCTDCQKWSGSAFSEQAVIAEGAITATGPVLEFSLPTPSGAISTQRACGVCHTRLWNTNSARAGIATVRAGTFSNCRELMPLAHIWVKSKQPWVKLAGDVPTFDEMAPLAKFIAILSR